VTSGSLERREVLTRLFVDLDRDAADVLLIQQTLKYLTCVPARRIERRCDRSETACNASDINSAAAGIAARRAATQLFQRFNPSDRRPNIDGWVHGDSQYMSHVNQQSDG
jgi:hypothetical protein